MHHTYGNFWDLWLLYHKAIFDGVAKLIYIAPGVTEINVQVDLYSDWKEWALIYQNPQYLAAMRAVGGDPLPGGVVLGNTFFLINGWRIVLNHGVRFVGNLYTEEGDSPFITVDGVEIAISEVSNLVDRVDVPAAIGEAALASAVWSQASGSFAAGTFGAHIANLVTTQIAAQTVTVTGSTTSIVRTALAIAANSYDDMYMQIISSGQTVVRRIDFHAGDGSLYPGEALPWTPTVGAIVFILAAHASTTKGGVG